MVSLAIALGVAAFAFSPPGLIRLTGVSPFPPSCEAHGAQRGSEVEPSIAAGPGVLVATWQQDRYLSSAAAGIGVAVSRDGGDSWQPASVPQITDCTPATNHASDPWVSVGPDGTVYLAVLVARPDRAGFRTRIAISVSRDGGVSWARPALLDAGGNGFNDKPSVTADPARPGRAYAVWTLEGQAYLARTSDGGRTWSPPRLVERGPRGGGLLSSTIAVLPGRGGGLLHAFIRYGPGVFRLETTRSADGGAHWSAPSVVARLVRRHVGGPPVRVLPISGTGAAATGSGAVYEDFVERGTDVDVARSGDGGRTWGRPRVAVHRRGGVFGPSLAAAPAPAGSTLALSYYVRGPGGGARFWIATSSDGVRWSRSVVTPPFPLARAPRSGGAAFLGDYSGLTASGGGFAAAFAVAPPLAASGASDVLVARR